MELPGMTASWMNFGFTKTVETNHPGADVARSWKTANRMRFMTFDQLKEQVSDQTLPFSAKMDGELVCIWHKQGKTELVTAKGTVRTSFPPTDELQKHWETKTEIVAMGELYAVDEQNIPQPSMQSASVFKDPDAGQDQLIRLAIFDLVEMDGSKLQDKSILERMEIVRLITTGLQSVHPAYTSRGTIQDMQGVWDNLEKRGLEGLVVHMPDGTLLKSKPVLDLDLVIVAVTKSPSLPGRIGAVLTALIDKTGRYRLNGMVGAGLSDDERVSFLSWARERAVREDEDKIWIDPTKSPVVTVECAGVRPQEQPALEFKNGVYVEVEGAMSGILRSPTFQQFRPDKNPTYEDARVEQLPFKVSSLHDRIEVGKWVRTITGHTGKVTAITPSIGDSGSDWDASIAWDPPLWGIQASEVHPDDVTAIADSKEELL
jgi:ATP-dependent DNA ligase